MPRHLATEATIWLRIHTIVRHPRDELSKGAVPVYVEPKIEAVAKEVRTLAAFYGQETL